MKEDLYMGISNPRNDKLADVFHKLNYIEVYGTGIKKIMQYYESLPIKPGINITNAAFVISLPNINYMADMIANQEKEVRPQYKQITDYLENHYFVTNKTVQNILNVGQTRAYIVIKDMLAIGLIKKDNYGNYILL
jgi:ATP-dependent DNA helicase RecG